MNECRENVGVSVIIPVYREEEGINPFLEELESSLAGDDCEIIVVDGHEQAGTLRAIRDKKAILLHSPRGRAKQMNYGARHSTGDILLFLHADTYLPGNALEMIRTALKDHQIVGGAFSLLIESESALLKLISRAANLRSRLTGVPYGDQAHFFRRNFFLGLGGYPEIPLMEDLEIMAKIRKSGHEIQILDAFVKTSARRWEKEGILRCTGRNIFIRCLYHLGVKPELLKKLYQ